MEATRNENATGENGGGGASTNNNMSSRPGIQNELEMVDDYENMGLMQCSDESGTYASNFMTEDEMFTYADLMGVMDGTPYMSLPGLTDLENNTPTETTWQSQQQQGFIPVNVNTKQIQGNEMRTVGGGAQPIPGHYIKYVSKDNVVTTGSNDSPRICENGNDSPSGKTPSFHLIEVQASNSSPAAGVSASAKQQTTASIAAAGKVRKPRGRKSKAVKAAEEAAAAAAAAAEEMKNQSHCTPAASPRNDGERTEYTPNVVIHHKAMNGSHHQGAGLFTQQNGPIMKQERSSYAHENVSLERLASQDRMEVLSRMNSSVVDGNRNGSGGTSSYCVGPSSMQSKNLEHGYVLGMTRSVPENRSSVVGNGSLQGNGFDGRITYQANFPRYGNSDATTAALLNNGSQQMYHEQQQQLGSNKSRLDQFISNRISNFAPPKRSVVAPSLIQRNLGLYTQLTAPKKQFDIENQKLSQEKWKQYPNPILNQRSHPTSNAVPSEIGNRIYGAPPIMQNLQKSADPIRDYEKNITNGHGMTGIGLEEAAPNGLPKGEMYHQTHFPQRYEAIRNQQNNNRRSFVGYGPNGMMMLQTRVQDLTTKLCSAGDEIHNLRMKIHLLNKVNRNLAMRVNLAEDQSEILKLKLRENIRSRKYRSLGASLNMGYGYEDEALLGGDDFEALTGFNDDGGGRTFLRSGDGPMIPEWKYQFDAVTQNQAGDSRLGLRRQIEVEETRGFTPFKREAGHSLDETPSKKLCASNKGEETIEVLVSCPSTSTSSSDSEVKLFQEPKNEIIDEIDRPLGPNIDVAKTSAPASTEKKVDLSLTTETESNIECGTGADSVGSSCSPKSEKSACDTDIVTSDYSENTTSTTFDSPLTAGARVTPFNENEISFKNNGFTNNNVQLMNS